MEKNNIRIYQSTQAYRQHKTLTSSTCKAVNHIEPSHIPTIEELRP
jgi:hypothetical protein